MENIETTIHNILADASGMESNEITNNMELDEFDEDEVIEQLFDTFDVDVSPAMFSTFNTVGDLVRFFEGTTNG